MGYLGNQITTVFPTSVSLDTVTASTSLKTPLVEFTDGDNAFTISDGGNVAFSGTVTGTKANTPAFQARRSSNFIFSDNTVTKVTGLTEDFDTDNNFASDTFTPTTAGKYCVTVAASMQGVTNYDMYNGELYLFKNGSQHLKISAQGNATNRTHRYAFSQTAIVDMNGSSDYLTMHCYLNNVGTDDGYLIPDSISFSAFRIGT
tara:strand:- start:299 stop:907 length:609 start_codon:yes stop_codon:yes gene_type:complete